MATIKETFTRYQLTGRGNPESNEVIAGQRIFKRLRERGVPVIGVLGILAVEWGTLHIAYEDGLDGDEWTYTFTGSLMSKEWIRRCMAGTCLKLDTSLAQRMREEDEL